MERDYKLLLTLVSGSMFGANSQPKFYTVGHERVLTLAVCCLERTLGLCIDSVLRSITGRTIVCFASLLRRRREFVSGRPYLWVSTDVTNVGFYSGVTQKSRSSKVAQVLSGYAKSAFRIDDSK